MEFFSFPDYLLLFVGVVNFALSVFIFVNDPKNKINKVFTIFSFLLTMWTILLLLYRNLPLAYAPFLLRSIYAAGLGVGISLWFFSHYFPTSTRVKYGSIVAVLSALVLGSFFIPNFLVIDVVRQDIKNSDRVAIQGVPGYLLFVVTFALAYLGGLVNFLRRMNKEGLIVKKQGRILLTGFVVLFIAAFYFNILLPSPFLKNYSYVHLGPLFTLVLVLTVGFAVAKYQFMNIKALISEVYVIVLIAILVPDLVAARGVYQVSFRLAVLGTVIFFSYLLIRSIIIEIKRREQVTTLARDLQDANSRLQELDRQKTEFLSIASHQLRTPLSVLNGYLGLLQEGGYGAPTSEMGEVFKNMDESNTRLIKLVDEFLDITRIEQGRAKFYYAPHDLGDIVDSCVKELGQRAEQKGLQLVWNRGHVPHVANVDDEKIRHGIFNFIDNAIKYSEHGSVLVKLEERDNGLVFTVTDTGLGFEEHDRLNFFQKFYRGENVQERMLTARVLDCMS